ncbi:uncharacterized protein LOC110057405, partial [Orbicella faveolata]|uniref:uncharacterized protein LOC110057405 n=1 Tax=Orbicella faveolata TaxID=48498 RepID=UPI0009E24F1A
MTDNEDPSAQFSFRLSTLQNASCAEEEILALQKLREALLPAGDEASSDEDDCEKEWLRKGLNDIRNPFPSESPESFILLQEDLDSFTFYLFERRFGWSEYTANLDDYYSVADEHLGRRGSSGSLRMQDESKFKGKLNELLDEFLKWFLAQAKLTEHLLKSFKYTVAKANNMPVVRNQTFVHIMDWLKLASSENGVNSKVFPLVMDIIIAGITDIWSAIRNTCVAKLSKFLELFTLPQLEDFYGSLVKMCIGKETSWQAKEGAVMCMTAIVCQFLWSGIAPSGEDKSQSTGPQYMLKFGLKALTALPGFITSSVHSVLFSLLAHPQLSIREHATKALSAILSRCEFEVALSSFQEVINRLCHGTQGDGQGQEVIEGIDKLPHHAVFREHFKFLKAHEAEGLLGVCIFLIKHIPPGFLLPKWPLYFSTLNLYLMHPASTVRQATSVAFKYLVAKDSSNPVFLKLVLQGLAADWKVDKDLLVANLKSSQGSTQLEPSTSNISHSSDDGVGKHVPSETQAPFQRSPSPALSPDLCYVSADSLSSFGTEVHGALSVGHSRTSPIQSYKSTRTSIRQVAKALAEGASSSADVLMSESWEWREGRLLAYELILKFLITNHIHYVFPTYVLPTSKGSATSSSVDETLISSLSNKGAANQSLFTRDRSNSDILTANTHSLCAKSNSIGIINSTTSGTLYSTTTIKEGESGVTDNKHTPTETIHHSRESSFTLRRKPMRAASCAAVDADTHTKQLIRQYSVATPQISPKRPFRLPRTSTFALVSELKQLTTLLKEKLTTYNLNHCYRNIFKICLCCLIYQVVLQTIECLADTRWELRRMGQQVLPLATEVVRWFDMKPLEILWDSYLSREHTLLCYGSCIALRYSILHAGRLMHFLEQPPPSWKDPESCGRAALTVVAEIQRGLKRWLKQVQDLLKDPCFDKLSVVAMETIMMSHICFPRDPDDYEQKLREEEIVLNKILFLYMYSYPDSPLGVVLRKKLSPEAHSPFIPPSEGFLSFSARACTTQQHAQQAGKFLISEVHPVLARFLKDCDADQLIMIFPVLVHHIGQFFEDSTMCRALLDGLFIILYRVEEVHMQGDTGEELHSLVQSYLDFSLLGLADVINTKFDLFGNNLLTLSSFAFSFSARACTTQQHAQQAGKFLISEVHPVLARFLKDCDADQLIMIFPVLVHHIGQFFEDSTMCRALLDGLFIILYRVEEVHMQGDTGEELHSLVQSYLDFSLLGLADVINTKELELQVVREVLEVFVRVCIFLDQPMFLSFVFKAISSRLDYVSSAHVVPLHKMYFFYIPLLVNTVAPWLVRSGPG